MFAKLEQLFARRVVDRHPRLHRREHAGDLAREVLAHWEQTVPRFLKIIPKDYKRMLACIERAQNQGLSGDEAIMAAFEENARDTSRVGGN